MLTKRCFMKKILNSLKKLSLPIVLAVTLCIGGIVSFNFKDKLEQPVSAAFLPQSQLSNSLPEYFKIELPENDGASSVNYVDDTIYLFNATSYKDIIIGDDEITQGDDETNWYYSPAQNNNGQIYYYFDFTSSLSLYYGLTASEVQNGTTGENLLKNRSVDNYIFAKENHFTPSNTSLTPKKLDIKFKLNTSNEDISFGEEEQKNVITLNQEGIYTLALPVIEYRTTNGGETFESSNKDIYYNFLIFDGNTYFDNITGKPKISLSNNVQESNLTSSSYSTYYFYNFAYAGSEADKDTNSLPTITYNPNLFWPDFAMMPSRI